jgi:MFS family permease
VLLLLGLLVVMAALIEDAPSSWSGVLLRTELGAPAAAAGLVHIAFQLAMTTSRLGGDRIVDRVGARTAARAGGAITAVGVGAGMLIGTVPAAVAGFALAGLGTGVLYPLAFDTAGSIPGVRAAHGIAVTSWIGRLGFLAAPPLVGAIGDASSVRTGLGLTIPAAGVGVVLLSGVLRRERTATAT